MKSSFTIALATAALVAAGSAFAERPATLAGTMTVLISALGDLGEYNFSAVK